MKYFDELTRAMVWLGEQPDTYFLGQAVKYAGTGMSNTIKNIADDKKWELPVCEDMQMGMTIGMSLRGTVPVSFFPRWNFLLLATNQLVNHLDKIPLMADTPFKPKVIIRTSIGSERPLNPQHQHVGDYTEPFTFMCPNIEIIRLEEPYQIMEGYEKAYKRIDGKSTILVEYGDFYNEK